MLFLVVANHKYGDRVPAEIGIQIIDQLMASMTKKELQKAGEIWQQVHLSTTILKRSTIGSLNAPNNCGGKKGKICTKRQVMIPPLMTTLVTGMADLTTHLNSLSVVEPIFGYSEHIATSRLYGELRSGKGKIDICLWNHSARQVTLPKQTTVGEITSVGVIPAQLAQKPTGLEEGQGETTKKMKNKGQREVLGKIDLAGLEEWSGDEQKETWELLTEYTSIFAMSDVDLGRTSLVKLSIKLTDNTPFKEQYWQIPPVCMTKIGII